MTRVRRLLAALLGAGPPRAVSGMKVRSSSSDFVLQQGRVRYENWIPSSIPRPEDSTDYRAGYRTCSSKTNGWDGTCQE